MSKKLWNKTLGASKRGMSAHNFYFWEKDNFCGLCKKTKITSREKLFWSTKKYLFLHKLQKMAFSWETLCEDIECPDVHLEGFFIFFNVMEYVSFVQWVDFWISYNLNYWKELESLETGIFLDYFKELRNLCDQVRWYPDWLTERMLVGYKLF
jgi:hypothetical protein